MTDDGMGVYLTNIPIVPNMVIEHASERRDKFFLIIRIPQIISANAVSATKNKRLRAVNMPR